MQEPLPPTVQPLPLRVHCGAGAAVPQEQPRLRDYAGGNPFPSLPTGVSVCVFRVERLTLLGRLDTSIVDENIRRAHNTLLCAVFFPTESTALVKISLHYLCWSMRTLPPPP